MTPPLAVTDDELAEVERAAAAYDRTTGTRENAEHYCHLADIGRRLAPRLAREVRAGRLWKSLALALIATRGRGNAPEVLRAIEALEQMGERVPAVVRLP